MKNRKQLALVLSIGLGVASAANAALTHLYTFNDGTANDSVGGANGTLQGSASVSDGQLALGGTGSYLSLPGPTIAINTYSSLTLEMWLTSSPNNTSYTMAAGFGRTFTGTNDPLSVAQGGTIANGDTWRGVQYIMIQPTRGGGPSASRVAITDLSFEAESGVNGPGQINDGLQHFLALTIDSANISYYIDGNLIGSSPLGANTIAGVSNLDAYLGKSLYPGDAPFIGSINQFDIYNSALSGSQIASDFAAGPIPEPSSLALVGLGIAGASLWRRRRA